MSPVMHLETVVDILFDLPDVRYEYDFFLWLCSPARAMASSSNEVS
jgi:hypothetical protein